MLEYAVVGFFALCIGGLVYDFCIKDFKENITFCVLLGSFCVAGFYLCAGVGYLVSRVFK
jgi:RsiW-degrading membrane proteinase PrsW (M82 family)